MDVAAVDVVGGGGGVGIEAVESVMIVLRCMMLNKLFSAAVAMHLYQSLELAELK